MFSNHNYETKEGVTCPPHINDNLISWASDIDPGTIRQAEKTARLPIVEGHVALMPDAHVGIGATVGSVIPTTGAVIPSAVGVDIGCGMVAAELDVTEGQLPDNLEPLLSRIEKAIPAGVGKGHDTGGPQRRALAGRPPAGHRPGRRPQHQGGQAVRHARLGKPLLRAVRRRAVPGWVVLHSGSRGIGNQLAQAHIAKARKLAKEAMLRSRTWTWPTSSRAPPSSRRTSPTCCGPRTTPGPTGTR